MRFSISQEVFHLFPDLQVVAAVLAGVDNSGPAGELTELIRNEEEQAKSIFATVRTGEHPNIGCWRKAYTKFGAGSDYRSSIEALVKRVVRGNQIPTINKLVDIYNLVSLKHLLPVGGEDLKMVQGNVALICASQDESFIPLGSGENDPPKKGEVVYVDDNNDVLCRRFNWREAEKTKLTESTTNAIIVIEGLPPVNDIEVKEAAHDIERYVKQFCGGEVELFLVNSTVPTVNF